MRIRSPLLLLAITLPALASAATITVRKDGTGQYRVLQQALDVAARGDTILIGPGEFADRTTVLLPNWTYQVESFAVLRADDVTIIGAGAGETTIGPVNDESCCGLPDTPQAISYDVGNGSISLRDLTVQNSALGVWAKGTLNLDHCEFRRNAGGVKWVAAGGGGHIRDTEFGGGGLVISGTGSGIEVVRSRISGGAAFFYARGPEVRDSEIGDVTLMVGAQISLLRCTSLPGSVGIRLAGPGGNLCEVDDCTIGGSYAALNIDQSAIDGRFLVNNSRLVGGSQAVLLVAAGSGACAIHGSDLVRGAGPAVVCGRSTASVTHDLTGNYWGTSNAADIRSWIIDHADDPNIGATVLYDPFAGQTVPVESLSWGTVKAHFR